jgi:hypothetical protein
MKKLARRMLPLVMALSLVAPLMAQDQPKTATPVARFSIASVDAIVKLATELGIPHADQMKTGIESAPFLAPGTLDTTKPLGFVIMAADPLKLLPNMENNFVVGIPVLSGKLTMDDLTKAGAKPVEGEPNTVSHQEFFARRGTDYLFAKPPTSTFGLSAMTDNIFAPEYRQPGTIAAMSLNFDAFRKAAPEAYKDLAANVINLPGLIMSGGMAGGAPANADAGKPVVAAFDKIDRYTLAVAQDEKNLHLRTWLSPSPIAAKPKSVPRPVFPDGTILQMHVVFPDGATAGLLEQQLTSMPEDTFSELPPVLRARAKDIVVRASHLVSQSDAVSLAFTMKDGHPIFYLVNQFNADVDGSKEINEIATTAAALSTEGGTKIAAEASTYDAGGKKVQRTIVAPDGVPQKLIIDTVQSDKVLYLTISDNPDGKYVGDLAAAGMNGTSSILCAGAVDLGATINALGGVGIPGLSPDKIESLKKTLAGQGITWTVQSSDQNFLYSDLAVPTDVIKEVIKAVGIGQ